MEKEIITLAESVIQKFLFMDQSFSIAESCTGGLLSSYVTSISGSSSVFSYGFITYSNQAKIDFLDVSPDTLLKYGAVSEEVAIEMSQGAIKKGISNSAISITGIAGPNSDNSFKPIGLVYISLTTTNKTVCTKNMFNGDRNQIRSLSCKTALNMLLNYNSS